MDLREAIEEYANAVSSRDYYDHHSDARRVAEVIRECRQNLDALLAVAEAAMAIVEQQESADNYACDDAVMGRGELWDRYRAERTKAKEVNREST